jgi:HSP20 family molecular chaperone IbpA
MFFGTFLNVYLNKISKEINGMTRLKNRNRYNKRPVDIMENIQEYVIRIYLPEYNSDDDITLNVSDEILTIKVSKGYLFGQKNRSSFRRYFKLPRNSNNREIKVKYNNSILNILIPKIRSFDLQDLLQ